MKFLDEKLLHLCDEIVEKKRGVVGFSRAFHKKIVNGREVDEEAVKFFVTEKKPLGELEPGDVIPKELRGRKTDVLELKVLEEKGGV